MKEFNWNKFKGNLLTKGKTIKQWCADNEIDYQRYIRIRSGRTKPSEKEILMFRKVLED